MSTLETSYDQWLPLTKDNIEPLLAEISARESTTYKFEPKSDMDLETLQSLQSSIHASIEATNSAWWWLAFIKDEYGAVSGTYEDIENGLDALRRILNELQLYSEDCFKIRAEKVEELDL